MAEYYVNPAWATCEDGTVVTFYDKNVTIGTDAFSDPLVLTSSAILTPDDVVYYTGTYIVDKNWYEGLELCGYDSVLSDVIVVKEAGEELYEYDQIWEYADGIFDDDLSELTFNLTLKSDVQAYTISMGRMFGFLSEGSSAVAGETTLTLDAANVYAEYGLIGGFEIAAANASFEQDTVNLNITDSTITLSGDGRGVFVGGRIQSKPNNDEQNLAQSLSVNAVDLHIDNSVIYTSVFAGQSIARTMADATGPVLTYDIAGVTYNVSEATITGMLAGGVWALSKTNATVGDIDMTIADSTIAIIQGGNYIGDYLTPETASTYSENGPNVATVEGTINLEISNTTADAVIGGSTVECNSDDVNLTQTAVDEDDITIAFDGGYAGIIELTGDAQSVANNNKSGSGCVVSYTMEGKSELYVTGEATVEEIMVTAAYQTKISSAYCTHAITAEVKDDSYIDISEDSTVGGVYGAVAIGTNASAEISDVAYVVDGASVEELYLAGYAADGGEVTAGDVSADLNGVISSLVYAGGYANNGGSITVNSAHITVAGAATEIDDIELVGLASGTTSAISITGDSVLDYTAGTISLVSGELSGASSIGGKTIFNVGTASAAIAGNVSTEIITVDELNFNASSVSYIGVAQEIGAVTVNGELNLSSAVDEGGEITCETFTIDSTNGALTMNSDSYVEFGTFTAADGSITFSLTGTRETGALMVCTSEDAMDYSALFDNWDDVKENLVVIGNDLYLDDGSLKVVFDPDPDGTRSFDIALTDTTWTDVAFDSAKVTYYFTEGLTANHAMDVTGNGVEETVLEGTVFYLGGYESSFSDIGINANVFGGKANLSGETVMLSTGISQSYNNVYVDDKKAIYGGINAAGSTGMSAVSGIELTISECDSTGTARVFGGGKVAGKAISSIGNIDVTFTDNGTFQNYFAGVEAASGFTGTVTIGTVSTSVNDGTFTYFGNGSQLRGGMSTQQDSSLEISGGTFNYYVYAGAFSAGGTAYVNGDTELTISGGAFNSLVFGGCGATNSANGANTTIEGNVAVTVDVSDENAVSFARDLYAGSMGYGLVKGNTSMTFTGLGANLSFADNAYVSGYSQMATDTNDYVNGTATLVFDAFTGNFAGNIQNGFDAVALTGSQVSLTGATRVKLNDISDWSIEVLSADAELNIGNAINSFSGDSLALTLGAEAEVTAAGLEVISGSESSLRGWDSFDTVSLFGEDAEFSDGAWKSDSYKLFYADSALKVATLA